MLKLEKQLIMNSRFTLLSIVVAAALFCSCSSPKYFHDESSLKRQKELQMNRSANVAVEVFSGILAGATTAAFDADFAYYPSGQQFKKINLINPTKDTMYVNMLCDVFWDEDNYCDFMDIRIPPKMDCKILVPIQANYNLYFSTTPESEDDEMFKFFTSDLKKIKLKPGMTVSNDTDFFDQDAVFSKEKN